MIIVKIRFYVLFSLIIIFSSCNWAVWKDVPKDYGSGTGSSSSTLDFVGSAPTAVYATKASNSSQINVSWNSVRGADYYEVFRGEVESVSADTANIEWTRLPEAPTNTSYVDTEVETNKIYAYKVRARSFSLLNVIGDDSAITYGWLLSAPQNITVSQGEDEEYIYISWEKVDGIKGYRIQWSSTGYDGDWKIATPDSNSTEDYIITANSSSFKFFPTSEYYGISLYFRLISVSNSGAESNPSSSRIGYTRVPGAPEAPQMLSASRGESTNNITISWKTMKPEDGEKTDYDWEIYRHSETEAERLIYSTLRGNPVPTDNAGTMSIVDSSNLKPSIEYTYSVRAIGEVELESGNKVVANGDTSTTTGFLFSPPSYTNMDYSLNPIGFMFTIVDALGANDPEHNDWVYILYGSSSPNGPWTEKIMEIPVTLEDKTILLEFNENQNSRNITGTTSYEYFNLVTYDPSEVKYSAYVSESEIVDYEPIKFARPEAPESE